jgi:HSP20 family protein
MENYEELREACNAYADPLFNLFGQVFTGDSFVPGMRADILKGEKENKIIAEVPGVKKEDIKLTLDKGVLTISYEVKERELEGFKKTYSEISSGKRMRSFTLGADVKKENISAALENGLLTITIAKPVVDEHEKLIDIL